MTVRKRRRVNKLRGKRFHGHGNTKNARGKGARGGMGRAGSHKHKFTSYWMTFGQKITLKAKPKPKAINLAEFLRLIPQWLSEKKAEKKGEKIVVDGYKVGYGKILGRGNVEQALVLSNLAVSKGAREKIEEAGGSVADPAGGATTATTGAGGDEDDEFEAEEAGENTEAEGEN